MKNRTSSHSIEIANGQRFGFGENWNRFLSSVDEKRIIDAEKSLQDMLEIQNFSHKKFLDIGSGSGLFSLAARRLGADVFSFDFDPQSVACTSELKNRYFHSDTKWRIEQGSVLDKNYMDKLGQFDIVYSWGVLHHTGAMWIALENAIHRVAGGGLLYIAIYNDQGLWSRVWWIIKYTYNKLPSSLGKIYGFFIWYTIIFLNILKYTLLLRPMEALSPLKPYQPKRGMAKKYDVIDWMGGFPFEYADYDVLVQYMISRGFDHKKGVSTKGLGCHELVFYLPLGADLDKVT